MTSVAPTSTKELGGTTEISPQPWRESCWRPCTTKLLHRWKQMQVSYYGGKYSIQRLLALDEYTRTASLVRVALVCAGTPMPMVALVLVQEWIPLQDPLDGWSANYGFWTRVVVLVWVVVNMLMLQATYFIDTFRITARQQIHLSTCASIGVVGLTMSIAAYAMFPIPFFVITAIPGFYLILIVSFRLVMGRAVVCQLRASRDQVVQFIQWVGAETSPVGIFPIYEYLFRAAEGTSYQLPVIFLLPLIKLLTKNITLRYTRLKEDMVPVQVIFTVDFFNALYVSTCMQSATSIAGVLTITVTDLAQTFVMLYGVQQRTGGLISRLQQAVEATTSPCNDRNILTITRLLCCNHESYRKQSQSGIRTHSNLCLQLSPTNQSVLESLDVVPSPTATKSHELPTKAGDSLPFTAWCSLNGRNSAIQPFVPKEVQCASSESAQTFEGLKSSRVMATRHSTILRETLETIFTTECIILTAYLEAFIPFFYSGFMLTMVHFPSALYHTEMAVVTMENVVSTVTPLLIFGLLQIGTFTLLTALIQRNCGMSALYQLAFVLEVHMPMIQCKLLLWMIITLCFRVKHFGVDFTFEFVRLGFPRLWSPP